MKFETRTEEDGKVVLSLGLTHEVGFPAELDINLVVEGVNRIVNEVVGISVQDLAQAVLREYEKKEKTSIEELENEGGLVEPEPERAECEF